MGVVVLALLLVWLWPREPLPALPALPATVPAVSTVPVAVTVSLTEPCCTLTVRPVLTWALGANSQK